MKKIAKKFGLSLATLACVACAGVGVSLSSSKSAIKADAAIAASDYWLASTGIRLVNDANGSGIRFNTNVTLDVYETIVESGTLIIPEVRCDGELTLDDLNNADERMRPVQVVTKDANTDLWYTFELVNEDGSTEDVKRSTVYLHELPESMYGARMVAVSYVTTAEGTTYTEIPSATSMSDVASKVDENSQYYKQAQPYVVDDVTVKYVMPDGTTQTETVAYGSKVSGPAYNKESYAISATDQYDKAIDFSNYEATLPVTIDVELTAKPKTTAVAGQLIKGLYRATAPERAWSNGPNGTAVTEGIPSGYSSMIRLDWYQQSTSQWVAGTNTNPLYRSQFNQNDISAYDRVTFAMKLETNGDAYVAARNKAVNFGNNKWLHFELIQTSANVWTLTITDDAGTELYKVTDAKADTKANGSGLSNDYDSVASLVFSRTGYTGAQGGAGWEASHMVALYPCTSQAMTASVYFTEILGYAKDTRAIPSDAITVADAVALTGTTNPNFAIVDHAEEAPAFFNNVTAFKSEQQWGGGYILGAGDFTAVNVKNYSEVWFAVKMVNGCITETAPAWKDVDSHKTSPWIYFHLIQQDNTMTDTSGNPTAAWTIEIIKDGVVWDTLTDQHANANDTIGRILDWNYTKVNGVDVNPGENGYDNGRIVFYQDRNNLDKPTYLYSTEVKGILKDGVTPPSSGSTETTTAMDIPTAAKGVRNYVWRDDRYALTAHANVTMAAPEGYSYVIEDVWNNHHTNITNQYTFAMDESLDVTAYSDLYLAMKIVDGTRIHVDNNTSGKHYTGTDWLYIHYHQESTGVWSYDVASPDGYSAASKSTISATTIKGLIEGKIYGVRDNVNMTTTKTYFTEVRGIPVDDTPWGDRVIWSAIDGARFADEYIAIPAGFTALYRYDGMSVTDAKCNFAAMDLSNTIYEEIRFGFINSDDFSFKAGYTYVGSDSVARNTTTIASHQGDWPKMNVVTLTKNDDGSWHVTIECKRWFDTADTINGIENQKMTEAPFEADVTANSLSAIMSTFMYSNGTKANVAYCTEVRGTHTCAYNNTKSLGNGYLQDYCICGEAIGDPVEFAHGIADEAVMANDSIWRDNNYALSTPDQVAPAGFENIEMYRWNLNSVIVNGVPYGSTSKDMSLTCLDEADVSAYDEVWFAMKNVGGTGFYVHNASKYEGDDWLYFHLVKVDGAWTLSLSSPDGYVAENVQTGIVGNTLQKILQYHGATDAEPWNSGAYPTKADGDYTTDVKIYFTEILGIIGCDHTAVNYVSNGDGTHNEVCANCATVITEDVTCSGGVATCTEAAVCSLCETAYGAALGHRNTTWSWGTETCGVCGETAGTAVTVASSAIIDSSSNAHLTPSNNAAGVTAPAGFSSVTNLFSASGNKWPSKILGAEDYASATLTAYDEVWFAIAITGGHFTNTADSWKNLDTDGELAWIKFHMIQTATNVWTVSIYKGDTLYKTFENRPGDTIYELTENDNNGLRLVIYQQTDGTNSIADTNVYATEVLGAFNTGISEYATGVWDHIWNPYYFTGGGEPEGAWSNEAAPAGFDKVSEYSWTTGGDFPVTGHFNDSDISAYSDLWFAMKAVNAEIYVQGGNSYTGGDWVYVHYHQNSDGSWTKDYRSVDGYFNNTSQVSGNITGTKLTETLSWKSGVNQGSHPNKATSGIKATGYFTNVIGVKKCTGEHGADKIVANGDGTHTVSCRCGVVISENAPCSGGTATCQSGAICSVCGYEYTGTTDHTGGEATCEQGAICSLCGTEYTEALGHTVANYTSNGDGTHNAVCACGAVIESNVACSGGVGNCLSDATCSLCGGSYETNAGHNVAWDGTTGTCTLCGETFYDMGISSAATVVWDHIWNPNNFTGGGIPEGAYSDMAAPAGFDKVSEYTCSTKDFAYKMGHFNASDISAYSDLWFAIKAVNVTEDGDAYVYLQGAPDNGYKGSEWVYVHYHQVSDGNWTKDYRTVDGYYSPSTNHTGITGTKLTDMISWKSGINQGSHPTATTGNTYTGYFTNVIGVLKCDGSNHTNFEAVSNDNGTHTWYCSCGAVAESNVACSGGTATCTEVAYCSDCRGVQQEALGHSGSWDGNTYTCATCGETVATVEETLEKQNVALFTNASSITANAETPAYITIVKDLDIDSVTSVTLNGQSYAATIEGDKLKINVLPKEVFGECILEATVVIKGKTFNITAPVLVVTNMITTAQGMLNMRYILRGADLTTMDKFLAIGGKGGDATMNGDGYYMLGADITMTTEKSYVFGTSYVPFVGTFDGNGHILKNYRQNNWFGSTKTDGVITSTTRQDNYLTPTQVANNTNVDSSPYGTYLEGSLFGVLNGLVKNVAFTGVEQAIFTNIVHSGSGRLQDVYIQIVDLQHNSNTYVPIIFARGEYGAGTLTNVVIDVQSATMEVASPGSRFPSLGKWYTPENVAVYGFDKSWISADGKSGNIYCDTDNVLGDGSEYGIYAEYTDSSTNGASFLKIALSDDIWKIVDGVPYLKNVSVSGTESAPSDSDHAVAPEAGVEYSIVWTDTAVPSYETAQFIKSTTSSAIGDLGLNIANLSDFSTKQIIVGSFETYGKYVNHDALVDGATDYGVYNVENTIFVLSETEEGLMFAAKELCRRLYGWNQLTYLAYDSEAIVLNSVTEIDASLVGSYTTQFAFEHRDPANDKGLTTAEKNDLGFTPGAPYTDIVSMHNAANFFGKHADTEETSKDVTELLASLDNWSYEETETFATTRGGAIPTDGNGNKIYQVCYTAHGDAETYWAMIDRVVNVIKAKKELNPNMTMANFMVEDNTQYCKCSICRQFSSPSVAQLLFLNAVQKQLNAQGVGVGVEFFAYNAFSFAPVLDTDTDASSNLTTFVNTLNANAGSHEPITVSTASVDYSSITTYSVSLGSTVLMAEDGLRLWWTTHEMNHSFPMEHVANAHIYPSLLAWIASIGGKNIDVFAYQTSYRNYFFPLNTWEYQILYYKTLHKLGVNSYMFNLGDVHNNADKQTAFSAFKTYIDSRAQADVNVTFEQLKDEFFAENGYYGAGGPTMRTFFEELVAVYESRKQNPDANTDFVDPTANVQISTMGTSTGYIATWLYNNADKYYNADDFSNYYACVRQGFFNGSYGWNLTALLFGGISTQSSNTISPSTDVYVHSDYASQQATLEAWYNYCTTALSKVDGNSKYAKRIQLEQLMPEYLYLVYYSKYTPNITYSSVSKKYTDNGVTSTFPTASTAITTEFYQDFYNRVKELGILNPSEFYGFGQKSGYQHVTKSGSTFVKSNKYMYENMFQNWNVKV